MVCIINWWIIPIPSASQLSWSSETELSIWRFECYLAVKIHHIWQVVKNIWQPWMHFCYISLCQHCSAGSGHHTVRKPHIRTSGLFLYVTVPVAVAWSSSDDSAVCYVLLVSLMTFCNLCLPIISEVEVMSVGCILGDSPMVKSDVYDCLVSVCILR